MTTSSLSCDLKQFYEDLDHIQDWIRETQQSRKLT